MWLLAATNSISLHAKEVRGVLPSNHIQPLRMECVMRGLAQSHIP